MEIVVRAILDAEIPSLEKLYTETIQEDFAEYGPQTIAYFANGKYKDNMMHSPMRLGAFIGDQLVGYVFAEHPFGGILFVQWLAIDKNFRGKGIGRKLLEAAEKIAFEKGVHALHLMSDARNVSFYEKCGYEVYGHDTKGYFGSDDYLLRKIITEPSEEKFFQIET